jgi:hypothetical protein
LIFQIKLEESGHCRDIACIENTRPLEIEELDNSVQVQINGGPQFALASIWNKASQHTDLSKMKQSRGHIQDTKTPTVETEAKKHEVQEISVMDDPGIFQVTKRNILQVLLEPVLELVPARKKEGRK